jgi:hypothetical protein
MFSLGETLTSSTLQCCCSRGHFLWMVKVIITPSFIITKILLDEVYAV